MNRRHYPKTTPPPEQKRFPKSGLGVVGIRRQLTVKRQGIQVAVVKNNMRSTVSVYYRPMIALMDYLPAGRKPSSPALVEPYRFSTLDRTASSASSVPS